MTKQIENLLKGNYRRFAKLFPLILNGEYYELNYERKHLKPIVVLWHEDDIFTLNFVSKINDEYEEYEEHVDTPRLEIRIDKESETVEVLQIINCITGYQEFVYFNKNGIPDYVNGMPDLDQQLFLNTVLKKALIETASFKYKLVDGVIYKEGEEDMIVIKFDEKGNPIK